MNSISHGSSNRFGLFEQGHQVEGLKRGPCPAHVVAIDARESLSFWICGRAIR
jgi:hypothetical protein